MLQIFRLALCFIVGRGHDPADHLNNYEMLVFLCYSCGLQKPFTLEKFNRIGGVMTPPYEYVVWKQYDKSQFVMKLAKKDSLVVRESKM